MSIQYDRGARDDLAELLPGARVLMPSGVPVLVCASELPGMCCELRAAGKWARWVVHSDGRISSAVLTGRGVRQWETSWHASDLRRADEA